MLKRYRNALLEKLEQSIFEQSINESGAEGLGIASFRGSYEEDSTIFHIEFINTPLWFRVWNPYQSYDHFCGQYNRFDRDWSHHHFGNSPALGIEFVKVLDHFETWIEREVIKLIEEVRLPDLWSQLESQRALVSLAPPQEQDTSAFSEAEKVQVRLAVQEFCSLVMENFKPQAEEMRIINSRLEYLVDAVDRLNRFDWKALAISTIIGIATTLSLDTQAGRTLFALFQQALRSVLHFLS